MPKTCNYDEEFKAEAVAKALSLGSVSAASKELSISRDTLSRWMKDKELVHRVKMAVYEACAQSAAEGMKLALDEMHHRLSEDQRGKLTNQDVKEYFKALSSFMKNFMAENSSNVNVSISIEDRIKQIREKRGLDE